MKTDATSPTGVPIIEPHADPAKSLDTLIAEQGVGPIERFEDLFGAARDWWTEEDFAAFLKQLRATHREQD